MSGLVVDVAEGSTDNGVEVSVVSASDLTLSDQASPPPPETEEGPSEASRNEEESPLDGAVSSQPDESGVSQLQDQDTESATAQDHESVPQDAEGMPPDAEGTPPQEDAEDTPPQNDTPSQDAEDTPLQDCKETLPESEGSPPSEKSPLHNNAVGTSTQDEEWQDILGSGQLMKKVIRAGLGTSTRPSQQSRVKVRTRGFLESGQVVDKHSGYWFTVGDGDVVQAWDIAVSLMECGEVARIKSAPRFAHGERGKGTTIPPNATITYEVELLEVKEPVDFGSIDEEELSKIVERKKARGNELYQDSDYAKATHSYQKGLQAIQRYLDQHSLATNIPPSLMEMQIRCLNNVAAAQLKLKQYREALSACERVLKADADNVKALYRAGRVLSHLGEMDDAVAKLKKAFSLLPQDKTIENELKRATKKRDQTMEKEKAMYRRMVGTDPKPGTSKSSNPPNTRGPWPYMAVAGITAVVAMGLAYFFTQRH